MSSWVEGKVVEVNWWTPSLFSLKVAADIEPFSAGQFTKLGLEIDNRKVARAYSFVNAPADPLLEFFLIEVEKGALSSQLAQLVEGDSVWVNTKPSGFFVLNEVPKANTLWMLSTGTAIGPFLSILADGKLWRDYDRVVLVHGVRHNTDLCYQDQIKATEKLFPQFTYVQLVSRETPENGLHGRVTDVLNNGKLLSYCNIEQFTKDHHFMLCGNPDMVKDTTAMLQEMGFKKHRRAESGHITVEQYW
ncbi:ferredoxin--NADP reductase [Pseudoalteromonas luteoviolacea]|uniref:ferredoxin--NADP reductase n=1 Tax=Pseudoalteromonas luteoviolacea TaxID=43657 RepID=UPI001B378358|nr:ferredoxin--NADP reductase [Pseudoalteromonas luteoviolacea]MBQ4811564.1 ferredoxin--NADP reductase [Pseudoalteromonas luteoviolacea]